MNYKRIELGALAVNEALYRTGFLKTFYKKLMVLVPTLSTGRMQPIERVGTNL